MSQKGPELHYAGTKYRKAWIENWLQDPIRIRPAGMFFGHHTIVTDEGDVVDEDSLSPHVKLSAEQAGAMANYLATQSANSDLVVMGEYLPKSVSQRMGAMNFRKFKGCSSCHQDEPDIGGVSGPELYTAYSRLNPDFIVSYIRNPELWDNASQMPHAKLKDSAIFKLVHYLKLISGDAE